MIFTFMLHTHIYIYTYVPPHVYLFFLLHIKSPFVKYYYFFRHSLIICRLHTTLPETNTPTEQKWWLEYDLSFPFGSWPIFGFEKNALRTWWPPNLLLPHLRGWSGFCQRLKEMRTLGFGSDRRIPPQDQWEGWRAMVVLDFGGTNLSNELIMIWVDDRIETADIHKSLCC